MSRKVPIAARAVLALALLVAQSGALAHAYSHRPIDLPGVPAALCDECVSFAPVLATAGSPSNAVLIARAETDPVVRYEPAPTVSSSPCRAFHARAPPASL